MDTRHESGTGRRARLGEAMRFLAAGGANTAFTYIIYLTLLNWIRYEFAYALAYILGIATSYLINSLFVFRKPLSWKAALAFPLIYVVQLVIGSIVLKVSVEWLSVSERYAPLVVIAITLPLTFLLSRRVVVGRTT